MYWFKINFQWMHACRKNTFFTSDIDTHFNDETPKLALKKL